MYKKTSDKEASENWKQNITPNKLLGQNFLVDKNILSKIIETADLSPTDIILEVGPGTGILTKELAQKVKKVIAIEKDPKLIKVLEQELDGFDNVKIIEEDILKIINPDSQFPIFNEFPISNPQSKKQYKVVANIPYYLTANLIRKFLEISAPPQMMVLMLQKEVAQRICAKTPDMNLLAVCVQFYATAKVIKFVPKECFWPVPKVDSVIVRITPLINADSKLICADRKKTNADLFFKIVKAGFSQPRKQLLNNLSRLNFPSEKNYGGQAKSSKINKEKIKEWLSKNNIEPNQRAETLEIKDWINLSNSFS